MRCIEFRCNHSKLSWPPWSPHLRFGKRFACRRACRKAARFWYGWCGFFRGVGSDWASPPAFFPATAPALVMPLALVRVAQRYQFRFPGWAQSAGWLLLAVWLAIRPLVAI